MALNINHSDKSVNSLQKVIFDEKALLYDEECLPEAGKKATCTCSKPVQGVGLAAGVDGGKGTWAPTVRPARGYMYPPPSIPCPSQQACTFWGPKYSNC